MNEQHVINKALRYVLDLLESVNHYPYHNINHTLEVYCRVGYLCDKEYIYLEDKTDLLLAALFHDTGFTRQYSGNEPIGAELAAEYLGSLGWKADRIEKIQRLILATVLFTPATDILEQIIQDADMDNIGRKDCLVKSMLVRKELRIIAGVDIPKGKWIQNTHELISKFEFRTSTSRMERGEMREENLNKFFLQAKKLAA